MTTIFPQSANMVATLILLGIAALFVGGLGWWWIWPRTNYARHVDWTIGQPVPFSHEHHVAGFGIDCRFCHASVEVSSNAGLPPTYTCMTCHSQIWTNADLLAPVRQSLADDKPIVWNRITDLPDYVYFNHSIHIAKGVGCSSCHGEMDRMPLSYKAKTLTMEFCLDCHREPGPASAAERSDLQHRMAADRRHALAGGADGGVPRWRAATHGLFDMSPVSRQWRSLERIGGRSVVHRARGRRNFRAWPRRWSSPHDRRRVLKLMAAAFAMAGLGGCDVGAPGGHLIPAVRMPPNIIPGLPNFYSTANVLDGYATGIVVKHQMGRPIKVEGNPQHPASLGATDVFAQAQVLDFYDPDRAWAINGTRFSRRSAGLARPL